MSEIVVYKEENTWKVVVDGVLLNETFTSESEAKKKGQSVKLLKG